MNEHLKDLPVSADSASSMDSKPFCNVTLSAGAFSAEISRTAIIISAILAQWPIKTSASIKSLCVIVNASELNCAAIPNVAFFRIPAVGAISPGSHPSPRASSSFTSRSPQRSR